MLVSKGHSRIPVTKDLHDGLLGRSRHCQSAGSIVPKIVKGKVDQLQPLHQSRETPRRWFKSRARNHRNRLVSRSRWT